MSVVGRGCALKVSGRPEFKSHSATICWVILGRLLNFSVVVFFRTTRIVVLSYGVF